MVFSVLSWGIFECSEKAMDCILRRSRKYASILFVTSVKDLGVIGTKINVVFRRLGISDQQNSGQLY